jgi:carbamoyltransferase
MAIILPDGILTNSSLQYVRDYIMENAYLGPEYTDLEIKNFLDSHNIKYKSFAHEKDLIEYTAKELISQKVIGWFQGRAEWGPRALGNRSILADARNAKMKDILNSKIKFRESFRPFAPSVLYEHAEEIFDVAEIKSQYPFKFMLYSLPVKNNIIPAATHIDNTSRPQFVRKEDNPLFYSLIYEYYKLTGVPAIINTSFNLKGEPIVNSLQDAYNTFTKSGMDILVMGKYAVER